MLKQVDKIEVLVLVDNKTDSLSTIPATSGSKDFQPEFVNLIKNGMTELSGSSQCCALHGLSLIITAHRGSHSKTVLFDAGNKPIKQGASRNNLKIKVLLTLEWITMVAVLVQSLETLTQ